MRLKLYQVDAFTNQLFKGNPAAVCPLENWLDESLMQRIAMENNLAETAFFVRRPDSIYDIRWFTPTVEVDLCGHATLASAFVLFSQEGYEHDLIHFFSPRSGDLIVSKQDDFLSMNFPADIYSPVGDPEQFSEAIGLVPKEVYKGKTDYMLVFEHEEQIRNAIPNLTWIAQLKARGLIITAKGKKVDFVSRFFGPQAGVHEDPVTGSAHTTLTPYWANQLKKEELTAMQLSARSGFLRCKHLDDRVEIQGQACLYLVGNIQIG